MKATGQGSNGRKRLNWTTAEGQRAWLGIGGAFLVFYLGEAVLFWRGGPGAGNFIGELPFGVPLVYPLGFWALFGAVVWALVRRSKRRKNADRKAQRWQTALLAAGITLGVVGTTYLVMRQSQDLTLGHTVLFSSMFLAAVVIGAMELNLGWLAAAAFWLATAVFIFGMPAGLDLVPGIHDEDIWVGIGAAGGFVLVGLFPRRVHRDGGSG